MEIYDHTEKNLEKTTINAKKKRITSVQKRIFGLFTTTKIGGSFIQENKQIDDVYDNTDTTPLHI